MISLLLCCDNCFSQVLDYAKTLRCQACPVSQGKTHHVFVLNRSLIAMLQVMLNDSDCSQLLFYPSYSVRLCYKAQSCHCQVVLQFNIRSAADQFHDALALPQNGLLSMNAEPSHLVFAP